MNPDTPLATYCLNCGATLVRRGGYCPGCGQKVGHPRLSMREIGREFLHALVHVDRSALSLVRALLVRPGVVARDYVSGKRRRYFGPFAFLVIVVAMASAVIAFSGFQAVSSPVPNAVANFLQRHINLLFFAQVPLLAAACRLLAFRDPFNYAEYLVLAAYTSGMHVLFYALIVVPVWYAFAPGAALAGHLYLASLPIWPLYFAYAHAQFLPARRFLSACRGIAAVLMTQATTLLLASAFADLNTRGPS